MYVIQRKYLKSDKWSVLHSYGNGGRIETMEEARSILDKMSKVEGIFFRVAEEYTVTRYKAVKIGEKK